MIIWTLFIRNTKVQYSHQKHQRYRIPVRIPRYSIPIWIPWYRIPHPETLILAYPWKSNNLKSKLIKSKAHQQTLNLKKLRNKVNLNKTKEYSFLSDLSSFPCPCEILKVSMIISYYSMYLLDYWKFLSPTRI